MATAHGAGLMLLPVALGLCMPAAAQAPSPAVAGLATAALVAAVHTGAMFTAGLGAAWAVYRWLGLRALSRSWINMEVVWGASLVTAGAASTLVAL